MKRSFIEWAQDEYWRACIGALDEQFSAAEEAAARREIEAERAKKRIVINFNKAWDCYENMLKNGSRTFNDDELREIGRILEETAEMKAVMTLRFSIKNYFKQYGFIVTAKKFGWQIRLTE